jgi:hypothetical protein
MERMALRDRLASLVTGRGSSTVQMAAVLALERFDDPVERANYYIRSPLCPEAIRFTGGAFCAYLRAVEGWSDQKIAANARRIVDCLSAENRET